MILNIFNHRDTVSTEKDDFQILAISQNLKIIWYLRGLCISVVQNIGDKH